MEGFYHLFCSLNMQSVEIPQFQIEGMLAHQMRGSVVDACCILCLKPKEQYNVTSVWQSEWKLKVCDIAATSMNKV